MKEGRIIGLMTYHQTDFNRMSSDYVKSDKNNEKKTQNQTYYR